MTNLKANTEIAKAFSFLTQAHYHLDTLAGAYMDEAFRVGDEDANYETLLARANEIGSHANEISNVIKTLQYIK